MSPSEFKALVLGATVVTGLLAAHVLRVWRKRPVAPDPWGPDVAEALEKSDATPICTHCQCPHEASRWFCPECGRAVGQFISVMPPLCYFELGDSLREGSRGKFRPSSITVAGFVIFGLAAFAALTPLFFLYPVYLWLLFRNLPRQKNAVAEEPPIIARS